MTCLQVHSANNQASFSYVQNNMAAALQMLEGLKHLLRLIGKSPAALTVMLCASHPRARFAYPMQPAFYRQNRREFQNSTLSQNS